MAAERDDLGALRRERRYTDVDVLRVVSRVGQTATDEFLEGLRPHLAAVQREERRAARGLASYLHDSAVSAVALIQMGGLDGLHEVEARVAQQPAQTVEEVISALQQLTSES